MIDFRTVEISDPVYERDGLRMVTVKSPALKRRADITLYLPPHCKAPVPLVILLHGVYGSHWAWAFSGGAHITAQQMMQGGEIQPIAIAMPSDGLWGDGSGYFRHTTGVDYESWIVEEVPAASALAAPGLVTAASLFLGGLSMGGYGALRLGAKYAGRFAGISAHSSLTHPQQLRRLIEEEMAHLGPLDAPELDPVFWMQQNRHVLPPIRFDCGTADELLAENRAMHERLVAAGIAHEYEEFAGGHDWPYWREHLRDTLRFCDKVSSKRG
ncbi:MAG: alpha/beta hydrolase [Candidatus Sumerlaeaceae bacterium]